MQRRPRVVLYIHRLVIAAPSGVHRYALELADALAAEPAEFDIELCSGRVRGTVVPPTHGVRLTHPRAPRRPLHLAWMLLSRPNLERVVGPVDLFHPTLPLAPIPSKAPQVITLHDLLPIHHPEWYPGVRGAAVRRAIRFHASRATKIITPSKVVAADVEHTLGVPGEKVHVIAEGASGMFAAPIDDASVRSVRTSFGVAERPYVIAVGAVSTRKNLEILFKALSMIRARGCTPPVVVVAGADGDGADAIHRAPARHGVEDLVRFTGWVSPTELRALLAGAGGLVHPSLFEGFGLTPLEAMAAGVPVVASTAGAVPEVVGDAGLLADPADADGWADAIERLLGDAELRNELVAAGRTRAAELTWETAARQTLDVYRQVLR